MQTSALYDFIASYVSPLFHRFFHLCFTFSDQAAPRSGFSLGDLLFLTLGASDFLASVGHMGDLCKELEKDTGFFTPSRILQLPEI